MLTYEHTGFAPYFEGCRRQKAGTLRQPAQELLRSA